MLVTISGSIGRALQSLPQTPDGLTVLEAALAVPTAEGKDWFALQFADPTLIRSVQQVRKGDTLAVTGELKFEPIASATDRFKPVVSVSDLQLCELPVAY
jgi:single-stranded DNA-binding protein